MASYLRDRERHLKLIPCPRVHCCDQHKCPDISNQFPEGPLVHYGKHFHDLLPCAALVWQNHGGILKPIKRHITGDHGSFAGNNLFDIPDVIKYNGRPTFSKNTALVFHTFCCRFSCQNYIHRGINSQILYWFRVISTASSHLILASSYRFTGILKLFDSFVAIASFAAFTEHHFVSFTGIYFDKNQTR